MFIPALVRGAASVSTGVISKAGKAINPKSILRAKRKVKVATGRIGKSFKDALNNSTYEHSPTQTAGNNQRNSSLSILNSAPVKLGAAISNSESSITNVMSNISEMSNNTQLKILLLEIRTVKEIVSQNGRDIRDVNLVAQQLYQSSSRLRSQLEIFKDSFDSDKILKDNELRDIQDNITKLQKSVKQLSDAVEANGGGAGGLLDMLSGGAGGKSGKAGKLSKLGKFAKLGAIAGIATSAIDIGTDAYDLSSGKKSIDQWDKENGEWSWWNLIDPYGAGKYAGAKINSATSYVGSKLTGNKDFTLGSGIYDGVNAVKGWFGASDEDKQREAELKSAIEIYNKRIAEGSKVSTSTATLITSSGYSIDPNAVSVGKGDTKITSGSPQPIKFEGIKTPTKADKLLDTTKSAVSTAVTATKSAASSAASSVSNAASSVATTVSESAGRVYKAVKSSPAVREAIAIKELIASGVTSPKALAYIMGQLSHESGGFKYYKELGGDKYFAKYDGRKDLGNTSPGDGAKYAGRGPIQITGKYNYAKFSKDSGIDVINNPTYLETPEGGIKSAIWYLKSRNLFKTAEDGDIKTLTKRINGGYNGLNDRIQKTKEYLDKFQGKSTDQISSSNDATAATAETEGLTSTSSTSTSGSNVVSSDGTPVTTSSGTLTTSPEYSTTPSKPSESGPSVAAAPINIPVTQSSGSGKLAGSEKSVNIRPGVDMSGVNPGLKANLFSMGEELFQQTGKRIQVNSAFRSSKDQARLYATKPKGQAARPGRSMHEFGYAVDINTGEANYLEKSGLLAKYGFHRPLLRLGETWHIEPTAIAGKYDQIRAGFNPTPDIQSTMASADGQSGSSDAAKASKESEGLINTNDSKLDVKTASAEPTAVSSATTPESNLPEISNSRDDNLQQSISASVDDSIKTIPDKVAKTVSETTAPKERPSGGVSNNTVINAPTMSGGPGHPSQTFFDKDNAARSAMDSLSMFMFISGIAIRG